MITVSLEIIFPLMGIAFIIFLGLLGIQVNLEKIVEELKRLK